jgi:hypothetical protein
VEVLCIRAGDDDLCSRFCESPSHLQTKPTRPASDEGTFSSEAKLVENRHATTKADDDGGFLPGIASLNGAEGIINLPASPFPAECAASWMKSFLFS